MWFFLCFASLQSPITTSYVEVQQGNCPLVISAPHGGSHKPKEFPDRKSGTLKRDSLTQEFSLALAKAYEQKTGQRPYVVSCSLHRLKVDLNRPVEKAAPEDSAGRLVWSQYHQALEKASQAALKWGGGRALLIDVHGHAHPEDWIELGYGVSAKDLAVKDAELADAAWIRGPTSLGARLQQAGFRAVPSPQIPHPGDKPYFNGGYIVRRHRSAGLRSVQWELPWSLRRKSGWKKNLPAMAQAIQQVMEDWFPAPEPAADN
ncbi:MAG: hypothetical protein DWQ01_12830 [Planctomycetota bacterium]|nr:MAG: hypothetical protein DWQ01_12830 [Planctomycetota bacterium]